MEFYNSIEDHYNIYLKCLFTLDSIQDSYSFMNEVDLFIQGTIILTNGKKIMSLQQYQKSIQNDLEHWNYYFDFLKKFQISIDWSSEIIIDHLQDLLIENKIKMMIFLKEIEIMTKLKEKMEFELNIHY